MKSKFFSLFYFVMILMCVHHNSFAQKEYDKDAVDSVMEQTSDDDSNEEYSDTVLRRTLVDYGSDSIQKWKRNREFAYMNYLDSLLKKRSDLKADTVSIDQSTGKVKYKSPVNSGMNKFLNSFPLKIFFWLLAIFFIGFIFYKIIFKNGIFDKIKNKSVETDNEDPQSGLSEYSEYDALIHEAETKNNFNLATRYLFLQTLKTLSDKGLINFSPDKTNRDYLNESSSQSYHSQFSLLTLNYEYVWYGKFLINESQYQKLKNEFILFNKKV